MGNRIDHQFAALREKRQAGFIAYISGGDPSLKQMAEIVCRLEQAGVDFLEIGVPFSDPLADGVANQMGAQRALAAGTTLTKLLATIRDLRNQVALPIILYSYLNPIYQYGTERFLENATASGVDGILLLDLPPDEELIALARTDLHQIRLVAPTTSESRIERISQRASGFIYYVSREGVTGERQDVAADLRDQIALIRRYSRLPIAVGFGISTPEQAAFVAETADAVVVGSAIVRKIGEWKDSPKLAESIRSLVEPLVHATHAARTSEESKATNCF